MAIKKRLNTSREADLLADELADKVYGAASPKEFLANDDFVVTSISLQRSMLHKLEDQALRNKRSGVGEKSVSALVRLAVSELLANN